MGGSTRDCFLNQLATNFCTHMMHRPPSQSRLILVTFHGPTTLSLSCDFVVRNLSELLYVALVSHTADRTFCLSFRGSKPYGIESCALCLSQVGPVRHACPHLQTLCWTRLFQSLATRFEPVTFRSRTLSVLASDTNQASACANEICLSKISGHVPSWHVHPVAR